MRWGPSLLGACLLVGCARPASYLPLDQWELEPPSGAPPTTVTLPAHLDGLLPEAASRYTLRRRVVLPPEYDGRPLVLAIPHLAASASLTVDGEPLADAGASMLDRYRAKGAHAWQIPARQSARGELSLALTIDHRWAPSGWLDTVPRLSAGERGDAGFQSIRAFNETTALAAGVVMLVILVLHGAVYFADRRRVAHGMVAVEALLALVYPAFLTGLLQAAFGAADSAIMVVLLTSSASAAVFFIHTYFSIPERPPRFWKVQPLLGLALALVLGSRGAFGALRLLVAYTGVVLFLCTVYHLAMLPRLLRLGNRPSNALPLSIGWPVACAVSTPDLLAWVGGGELLGGYHPACVGIALVSFLRAISLAREHTRSLRSTDRLNADLRVRIDQADQSRREVEQLNQELRRQIAARSQLLFDSLARIATGPTAKATMAEGTVVEGRYRIARQLGTGGMGSVYEVERLTDGRHLALKVLTEVSGGASLARFAREARIIAQIQHPNVVSIVDVDIAGTGFLFLVLELVDGQALSALRPRFGDVRWALAVLEQLARGVAAVHERGVVHRDLKPSNVLVSERPGGLEVKITDFGISSEEASGERDAAGGDGAETPTVSELPAGSRREQSTAPIACVSDRAVVTQEGALLGTPKYMAPELAQGVRRAAPPADIFSWGVIAYELLTAAAPFTESAIDLRLSGRHLGPPAPVMERAPDTPPEVAALVEAALTEEAAARPTARTLVDAFERRPAVRVARPGAPVADALGE
jgi:serine/threonine-protein kinase